MRLVHNRRLWQIVLSAMLVSLAFVAFWPSPTDQPVQGQLADILAFLHSSGIPRWFNYQFIEAVGNIALFVPLGIVSTFAFPEKRWWQVGAFGLSVSGCMELGQLLFLHNRFASPLDLITNTSGAIIGAFVATAAIQRVQGGGSYAADLPSNR